MYFCNYHLHPPGVNDGVGENTRQARDRHTIEGPVKKAIIGEKGTALQNYANNKEIIYMFYKHSYNAASKHKRQSICFGLFLLWLS